MSEELPVTALSRGACRDFPELAARHLEEYLDKIRFTVALLDEQQLWRRPGADLPDAPTRTNSVGNLILHLCGNLSLWLLSGVAGESYRRRRSEEFTARGGLGRDELIARLTGVVERATKAIRALSTERLAESRGIQGYDTNVLCAVFHAVEHMSYHTGQIVLMVKEQVGARTAIELYPRHAGE